MKSVSREKLEAELKGTTLRVYITMLKLSKPVGVRELQRIMGFRSPNTALYHLEKLRRLGLVDKNIEGEYLVVREAKVGQLLFFTKIGSLMVPRFLFYAVFFTVFLLSYLIMEKPNLYAILASGLAAAFFWVETIRAWMNKIF
ncbi:MAG: hypothetical protein DRJ52_02255 [Thermoprotei archaeon]|nr:MAG: hypothetical protein DRJ52_02255 [Thermoprotei archaeon]RLF01134.1 MAG: hypothetical protein DRJ63_00070 [Thermoprotei archaeon]